MRKLVYSLLFISSLSFSQTEKNVGDFTKVTAFDKIEVTLIAGSENKVVLSGENSEEVELINKNGELKIRMPFTKMLSGEDISATVYYINLEAVEANEGSILTAEDEITTINFDIICKEGATITISNLQADRLQVRTSAGSVVTVNGTVKNQDILSNSGGKFNGQNCLSEQTTVTVNAGGIANVNASNFVDAKTRAGGEIIIYGKPKQINQKTIAGGRIEQAK
ncbi:MAG: head GIN domain-containing protein [Bacteroidota bacterium]